MSSICLKVELMAGTNFYDAVVEAKDLAKKLDLAYVTFNFNTVEVSVSRYPLLKEREGLCQELCDAMKSAHKFMIV